MGSSNSISIPEVSTIGYIADNITDYSQDNTENNASNNTANTYISITNKFYDEDEDEDEVVKNKKKEHFENLINEIKTSINHYILFDNYSKKNNVIVEDLKNTNQKQNNNLKHKNENINKLKEDLTNINILMNDKIYNKKIFYIINNILILFVLIVYFKNHHS